MCAGIIFFQNTLVAKENLVLQYSYGMPARYVSDR